ncbi:MAG: hypothetical protein Q4D04_00660 [Clostridia bacterium]|nr:hypothetical protein [Clostridia bacterium]
MSKKKGNEKKTVIRIVALVLCIMLVGTAIYASIASIAYAQTAVTAVYDAGNAAFAASQATVFHNDTGERLTQLPFAVYFNFLRTNGALSADPGGVELYEVKADGEDAPWSFSLDECELLVDCEIDPGASVAIEFTYSILLPQSSDIAANGDMGARLSFFYPSYLPYGENGFDYCEMSDVNAGVYFPEQEFDLSVTLPAGYMAVAGVEPEITHVEGGNVYAFHFDAARDVSLAVSRRYSEYRSDYAVAFTNNALAAKTALEAADRAVALFNERLGGDLSRVYIAQVDQDEEVAAHTFVVWLSSDVIASRGDVEKAVVEGIARQYFAQSVVTHPEYEPWLSQALSGYLTCLYYREVYSESRFLDVLNDYALYAVSTTIPGGLSVDSELSLFRSREEFKAVALGRGVAVLNELRHVMGFDAMWEALNIYYRENAHSTATIADFADAVNRSYGSSLDSLIIETLQSIGDYINQLPQRLD